MRKILLFTSVAALFFFQSVSSQTFDSGQENKAIPNDWAVLKSSIEVSGISSVIDADFGIESVCVDIEHTADWDLLLTLIAPDGTRIILANRQGDTLDNFTNTCFQMDAAYSVINSDPPFSGNHRPIGGLGAANNGQNPNGTWKLAVHDRWPGNSDTGTLLSWKISFGNSPAPPLSFNSELPIVVISTGNREVHDEPKITADMGIIYEGPGKTNQFPGMFNHYKGMIGIEFRGNSSQQFPKKSYGFETKDSTGNSLNVSLLDLPPENDWILDASYTDKSLMRNFLSYTLYREMGHYSPRQRYVEVVIDNQYQGVYILTEKIKRDKDRLDVAAMTPQDKTGDAVTGGYILKINKRKGEKGFYSNYPSNSNGDKIYYQFEEPGEDEINKEQKDYIHGFIDDFEDAVVSPEFDDPENGYMQFIEPVSFMDNFIIHEVSKNTDGYRLNTFLYKDRDSRGGRLIHGPVWDMDIAWFNANFGGGDDVVGWQYEFGWDFQPGSGDIYPSPFWWRRFMEDTRFVNSLNCRYFKFRGQMLNKTFIFSLLDEKAKALETAQQRNFHQWPVIGLYVWPNPGPIPQSYKEEVKRLKNWFSDRIQWLDKEFPGSCQATKVPGVNLGDPSIEAFPNPFKNDLQVNYSLNMPGKVVVELFNAIGRRMQKVELGMQQEGAYHQKIATHHLPPGIYILNMRMPGGIHLQKKLVKME